jgi:hypothetical protein
VLFRLLTASSQTRTCEICIINTFLQPVDYRWVIGRDEQGWHCFCLGKRHDRRSSSCAQHHAIAIRERLRPTDSQRGSPKTPAGKFRTKFPMRRRMWPERNSEP